MTEPNPGPTGDQVAEEPVDEQLDTTDAPRDPLTTDDGLAAAAENMPAVDDDREVDSTHGNVTNGPVQDAPAPGLDITQDGTDPLAELATPGDDKED